MFVAAEERDGAAYREFWAKLSRGEFQSGEFQRVGRGGRQIWIQASYNPILGRDGRPFKVVKFATDITAQMALLGDLRTLIDKNFAEIDTAIDRASGRGGVDGGGEIGQGHGAALSRHGRPGADHPRLATWMKRGRRGGSGRARA